MTWPSARAKAAWPLAALLLLTLLAYSGSFGGAFQFDDQRSIVDNPVIRDLRNFLPGGEGYHQRPNRSVAYLTFALNHRAGGLAPAGYHAVNLAIHLLNGLLVLALVRLAFRTPRLAGSALAPRASEIAAVAALLFATHPLQTQAVTYVVQRITSLATTFCLLTLVLYLRWRLAPSGPSRRPARAAGYLLLLLTAALAMRTKEIAFTFPLVIALFDLYLLDGPWTTRLAALAPLVACMGIIPATVLSTAGAAADFGDVQRLTRVQTSLGRLDYLATELPVMATYLRLLVLPLGQNLDHDFPLFHSFLAAPVAASALLLGSLVAFGCWLLLARTRPGPRPLDPAARLVALGIAWFFLALLLESSVIPIVDVIFEHRAYLPSVGFFLAVSAGGGLLARRLGDARGRVLFLGAGLALAAGLSAATYARNEVWATPLSLWADAAAKSPGKSRPQNNLGAALDAAGRDDEALPHVLAAIRLDPGNAEAHYNLGRIRLVQGDYAGALDSLQTAVALQPAQPEAWANLAAVLNRLRRFDETVRLVGDGARIDGSADGHFNLGVALAALGDDDAARREIRLLEDRAPALARNLAAYLEGLRGSPR
ncbi:MAG TPA: tetratricopeptide repeat protein [Anaeromyxobacteraceae bacterium]|nr:tetratricopeptide repeat protein [Anaeromyxobacteraceae bacterium]